MSDADLPILDLSPFLRDPESVQGIRFVDAFRAACHGPGFCYLVGHGVAEPLNERVMTATRRFFALPEADRRAIAIGNSPHFRGYTLLGDERARGRQDWRDQIDIGPEEPPLALSEGDPPWLRLRGPNQWPAALPELRETVIEWMEAMHSLASSLMRAVALALGQPADRFAAAMYPNPYTRLKIIRYPAQRSNLDTGQGLGLHQDSGLLSLVLQDGVGGLEVETPGGLVAASPKPGAFIMNLGEMLQAASNGYFRATPHRVESPPPGSERISLAYFVNPRLDAVLEPVELPAALSSGARGTQNADPSDPVFSRFGENTLKIRMRSHPDVTRAHYAGVQLGGDF